MKKSKSPKSPMWPLLVLGGICSLIILGVCTSISLFNHWYFVLGIWAIGVVIAGAIINWRDYKKEEHEIDLLFNQRPSRKELLKKIDSLTKLKDTQAKEGDFDQNEYMVGLFNGLELALALLEGKAS